MVWRLRRARTSLPAGIAIFLPLLAAQQQLSLAVSAPSPSPPSSSSSLRQDARLHPHVDILPRHSRLSLRPRGVVLHRCERPRYFGSGRLQPGRSRNGLCRSAA
ncbi:hypothetical protein CPSG_09124, partial [Coccidioides posadasii str. Silveira]